MSSGSTTFLQRIIVLFLLTAILLLIGCFLIVGSDHGMATMYHEQNSSLAMHLDHSGVVGSTIFSSGSLVALLAQLLALSLIVLALHVRVAYPRIENPQKKRYSVLDAPHISDRERHWFSHRFVRSPNFLIPA